MTNIVTRKGLAFGALVALASTAIAGAPAHAAGELNVAPSAGTSYTTLEGTVFNLKTTFAPGFTPSSYAQLKYQIKTDANSTVSYGVDTAAVTAPGTSVAVSTTTVSGSTSGAGATTVNYLGLQSTTASATTSVEVTAFVDANNDGALSAGEWNTVRTVTFKKVADVAPAVTVAAASTGDTTATATVNWGDLNVEQISRSGAFGVATGSTNKSLGLEIKVGSGSYAAASWNSSTSKFTASVSALASGDVVSAQAVYATNTYVASPVSNTYSSVALGSAATATASARTINTTNGLVANLVKGNDAIATSATTIAATTGGVVRTNGSFTVSAVAKDTASTPAVKSGVAVTGSVAGTFATALRAATSSLTEISVTVNGTKYTTNASLAAATFALTTDANGVASLNISSTGLAAGDTLVASFSAQNLTASVATTQTDVTYTVTDTSAAPIIATNKNTAVTLSRAVKDQFGVLSTATNQRLYTTQTNATVANQYVPIVNGVASFTVTPATDSTADVVVTSVIQTSSTAGNGNVTWTAGTSTNVTSTIKVRAAAYSFSTAPALAQVNGANYDATNNAVQTITQSALADLSTAPTASTTTWAKITLTGSNAGEKLTVSGADFVSIDGDAVAAGSASKVAQAAAVSVYVASNTIGTKTITITNGTVTKTVDVKFASAAVNTTNSAVATSVQATAKTFAVSVPANAQSGRAIDATVTVTDKFGNPVAGFAATASVSGVAVVNGGYTAAVTTDANGQATVKLSAGVNDLGDAVVTFSDNDVNTTTNVTSVAKTVTFGSTDGYIDVLNGKRASVTWSFAKGKRVAVYLDGVRRYNIVQPGDSELNLQFNLKKGSHNIKLVIGGVIVDTISVKVAG